jgi:excisionase family DNA binding protein
MSDRFLIALPGLGTLSLSREAFEAALADGSKAIAPPATAGAAKDAERLLSAEELAEQLNVPASRIESGARQGTIPSVRVGRYVRFRRSSVERALTAASGKGSAA